jgi:hypothetical protein
VQRSSHRSAGRVRVLARAFEPRGNQVNAHVCEPLQDDCQQGAFLVPQREWPRGVHAHASAVRSCPAEGSSTLLRSAHCGHSNAALSAECKARPRARQVRVNEVADKDTMLASMKSEIQALKQKLAEVESAPKKVRPGPAVSPTARLPAWPVAASRLRLMCLSGVKSCPAVPRSLLRACGALFGS